MSKKTTPDNTSKAKQPYQNKKGQYALWFIAIAVIIVSLIGTVGMVYSMQKFRQGKANLEQQIARLQNQLTDLQQSEPAQPPLNLPPTRIALLTPLPTSTTTSTQPPYADWKTFTNGNLGYSVKYPANASLTGTDYDKMVTFEGPLVENDHWPVLSISHYDTPFYKPPAGTDVKDWVTSQASYDEVGAETVIAGTPTVHLITKRSPQAYASDDYYFTKNSRLYHVNILHTGDKQDWDLYNYFLSNITFTATP